ALPLGTPHHVKERLASRVVDPRGHLVASDTRLRLVRAGIAAAWCAPWSPLRMRVAQSLGFLALATLPRAVIAPILPLLLTDYERPRWLSRLAGMEVYGDPSAHDPSRCRRCRPHPEMGGRGILAHVRPARGDGI